MSSTRSRRRRGMSVLELLAVTATLAAIAVVLLPRISITAQAARHTAHQQNVAEINAAVDRWFFDKGSYPAADLSDIGSDENYFPNGVPTNPLTGGKYSLDTNRRAR